MCASDLISHSLPVRPILKCPGLDMVHASGEDRRSLLSLHGWVSTEGAGCVIGPTRGLQGSDTRIRKRQANITNAKHHHLA